MRQYQKKSATQSLPENIKMALRPNLQFSKGTGLRAPEKRFDLSLQDTRCLLEHSF